MHHTSGGQRSSKGILRLLPCADTLGVAASTLCLVHCMVLPFILAVAPAVSSSFLHDDKTHFVLAFFVALFCLLGILPGYLRHSRLPVLLMMIVGLSLVLFATFAAALMLGERFEVPLITAGNLIVVAAHIRNRQLLSCPH